MYKVFVNVQTLFINVLATLRFLINALPCTNNKNIMKKIVTLKSTSINYAILFFSKMKQAKSFKAKIHVSEHITIFFCFVQLS